MAGGLLGGPLAGMFLNIGTGALGTHVLNQNRPQYQNPFEGLGINLNRPLGIQLPTGHGGTPEAVRAAGGTHMQGTPEGVATQMARDREAAYGLAREAETESREALGDFRSGMQTTQRNLTQGMADLDQQMVQGQQYFNQAREAAQQLPQIIDSQIGDALTAIRSLTGDVRNMAQEAKDDLGDFVVEKMEGMRAGIDSQFDQIERQALDGLYAQQGGVSTAERQALQRSLALEKGRTISQAYQPVLAAETERLTQANVALTEIVQRMSGIEAGVTGQLAAAGTDAHVRAAQLQEQLADHQSAMEQGYKIAKWNLGTFAEQLRQQGNEVAFNLVQQIPRPFLMMADINNYLLGQYYGLVETNNMLEQARFGDIQTVMSPLLSGMQTGVNTLQSRSMQEEQLDAQRDASQMGMWGDIVGGGLSMMGGFA